MELSDFDLEAFAGGTRKTFRAASAAAPAPLPRTPAAPAPAAAPGPVWPIPPIGAWLPPDMRGGPAGAAPFGAPMGGGCAGGQCGP